jgi:hypothetical protein
MARVEVERVATPLEFRAEVPSVAAPSRKVTVPVGVPVSFIDVTDAVNVTSWPEVEGLGDEPTTVAVAARLVFMSTLTSPLVQLASEQELATSRSGFPSAFTSAKDTDRATCPPDA